MLFTIFDNIQELVELTQIYAQTWFKTQNLVANIVHWGY
jgi:hypothetical protein